MSKSGVHFLERQNKRDTIITNWSVILAAEGKMIFILEWRKWAAYQQISTNTCLLFSMKHFANFLCHSLHYQILYVLFASPRRSNIPGPWRKMCKYRNNYTQKTALVCCAVCVVYMIVVENTVFVHRPSGHKKYRPLWTIELANFMRK